MHTPVPAHQTAIVLWSRMVEVLGAATTATLVRRGIKRAAATNPVLNEVRVERAGLDYTCSIPESCSDEVAARSALSALGRELRGILAELTGDIVLAQLAATPELHALGLTPRLDERST